MTAVNRSWRERLEARTRVGPPAAAPCPTCRSVDGEPCVTAAGKIRDSWHKARE